jgi:hypothetical protein
MGTGKQRISTAVRLAAKVAGRRVLGLELALVVAPELERGLVAAEPVHGQAVAELVLVPVVAELERGRVVAALVLVPVVAALVLGQVAVALRTKSVTAAHHHGLVPRLAVEDLVAVAETTHEPAATEAGAAWAAAVTVAAAALDIAGVVAAVVVAPELAVVVAEDAAEAAEEAADVAAEDAGGNQLTNQ